MPRFVLKFILFLIPVSLIFAFPFTVFFLGREYLSIAQVVEAQKADPDIVFGPVLTLQNYFGAYKLESVEARRPAVIALGSSRVLELRDALFTNPATFYNAGKGAADTSDLLPFIDALTPDARPKIILLGLDPSYVTANAAITETSGIPPSFLTRTHDFLAYGWREAYHQYFLGHFTLGGLLGAHEANPDIGLSALINGNGFRSDGSFDYAGVTNDPNHAQEIAGQVAATVQAIQSGTGSEYGSSVDQTKLMELGAFLAQAKAEHVEVIGFITPYASEVSKALDARHDAAAATRAAARSSLASLFASYGQPFYDLESLSSFGSSDTELIDPLHIDETASARLLAYIAARNPALSAYVRP